MSNSKKANNPQKGSLNGQGSGSEYHKEHAGNVEGYGEQHLDSVNNATKKQ